MSSHGMFSFTNKENEFGQGEKCFRQWDDLFELPKQLFQLIDREEFYQFYVKKFVIYIFGWNKIFIFQVSL